MAENMTPLHLRCGFGSCPSIHRLKDGSLLIVGTYASHCDGQASDLREQLGMANKIASHETAIVITRDFLEDLFQQWADERGLK